MHVGLDLTLNVYFHRRQSVKSNLSLSSGCQDGHSRIVFVSFNNFSDPRTRIGINFKATLMELFDVFQLQCPEKFSKIGSHEDSDVIALWRKWRYGFLEIN